jgi:hypothetical protein
MGWGGGMRGAGMPELATSARASEDLGEGRRGASGGVRSMRRVHGVGGGSQESGRATRCVRPGQGARLPGFGVGVGAARQGTIRACSGFRLLSGCMGVRMRQGCVGTARPEAWGNK